MFVKRYNRDKQIHKSYHSRQTHATLCPFHHENHTSEAFVLPFSLLHKLLLLPFFNRFHLKWKIAWEYNLFFFWNPSLLFFLLFFFFFCVPPPLKRALFFYFPKGPYSLVSQETKSTFAVAKKPCFFTSQETMPLHFLNLFIFLSKKTWW